MEDNPDASETPKGHSRTPSHGRRQALPRRSTRDPLDGGDPLKQSPAPSPVRQSTQLLAVPDPRTASRSRSRSREASAKPRNFGYLLKPENYAKLTYDSIPAEYKPTSQAEPSDTALGNAIAEGRFLTAAMIAGELLQAKSDPTDHIAIFALLYARLSCLQLSGLHDVAAQESKALQDLNAPIYRDQASGHHLVPWNLRVLAVRLQAIGFDDWRQGVMNYYSLAREARLRFRRSESNRDLWQTRLQDISIRIANALVEMGDLGGTARHLESLPATQDPQMAQRLALVYLNIGDVERARHCLDQDIPDSRQSGSYLRALCSMADGDYEGALEGPAGWLVNQDFYREVRGSGLVTQNVAACYLYTGRIQEARSLIEQLHEDGDVSGMSLFNLATIYELCTGDPTERKAGLAANIAKLDPSAAHRQRANIDFKL